MVFVLNIVDMSVRSRDSREGARRHADSAEVKDLSHQFGSLSLSDSKKGESENVSSRLVVSCKLHAPMCSQREVRPHTLIKDI